MSYPRGASRVIKIPSTLRCFFLFPCLSNVCYHFQSDLAHLSKSQHFRFLKYYVVVCAYFADHLPVVLVSRLSVCFSPASAFTVIHTTLQVFISDFVYRTGLLLAMFLFGFRDHLGCNCNHTSPLLL